MATKLNVWLAGSVVACAALLCAAAPASAQFQVEEPEVEKGEVEIEYNGSYFDGLPKRRFQFVDDGEELLVDDQELKKQGHEIEIGIGITDWLRLTIGGEFEEERREEVRFLGEKDDFLVLRGTEVEGNLMVEVLPLNESGNGFGLSLFLGLTSAVEAAEGNVFTVGPAMTLVQGPFSATANLFFSKAYGGDDEFEEDEDGNQVLEERFDDRWDFQYAYQFGYAVNSKLTLAVEGYGTIERLGSTGWEAQANDEIIEELADLGVSHRELFRDHNTHYIGPVLYYKLLGENEGAGGEEEEGEEENEAPSLTMGLGVLFGLNNDTPDTAVKWSLAAEF